MYPITTLTASLLALFYIVLSIKVIKLRKQYKVSLGANGYNQLDKAIRGHGNFSEYVPITLILLLCAEAHQAHWIGLSLLMLVFIIGRLMHAYAFTYEHHHFKFRSRGMILTFAVIACLSFLNLGLMTLQLFK